MIVIDRISINKSNLLTLPGYVHRGEDLDVAAGVSDGIDQLHVLFSFGEVGTPVIIMRGKRSVAIFNKAALFIIFCFRTEQLSRFHYMPSWPCIRLILNRSFFSATSDSLHSLTEFLPSGAREIQLHVMEPDYFISPEGIPTINKEKYGAPQQSEFSEPLRFSKRYKNRLNTIIKAVTGKQENYSDPPE